MEFRRSLPGCHFDLELRSADHDLTDMTGQSGALPLTPFTRSNSCFPMSVLSMLPSNSPDPVPGPIGPHRYRIEIRVIAFIRRDRNGDPRFGRIH